MAWVLGDVVLVMGTEKVLMSRAWVMFSWGKAVPLESCEA